MVEKRSKFWVEYSGVVTIGIDTSLVTMEIDGDIVTMHQFLLLRSLGAKWTKRL